VIEVRKGKTPEEAGENLLSLQPRTRKKRKVYSLMRPEGGGEKRVRLQKGKTSTQKGRKGIVPAQEGGKKKDYKERGRYPSIEPNLGKIPSNENGLSGYRQKRENKVQSMKKRGKKGSLDRCEERRRACPFAQV